MKYIVAFVLLIFGQNANAQKEIKLVPEMWKTTTRWNNKYTFQTTESINLGLLDGYRFGIVLGQNKESEQYCIITEIIDATEKWYFTGGLKLISGHGTEIICRDMYLNSNLPHDGRPKIRSLFLLTSSEYQILESQGLVSVAVSVKQNGSYDIKSYMFNNFSLEFDLREKAQREKEGEGNYVQNLETVKREKEELRLQDSIVQQAKLQRHQAESERRDAAAKEKYEQEEARRKADSDRKKNSSQKVGSPGKADISPLGNSVKVSYQIEGMEGRAIASKPPQIENTFQSKGIVVINFCVDENGNVISANKTLSGSTTLDSELVKTATENVQKFQFVSSPNKRECGVIKFKFNVK